MSAINNDIKRFAVFYFASFALYFLWSCWYGLTFSQIEPVFFYNQLDLTGNALLLTKVHFSLIQNKTTQIIFDVLYIVLPAVMTVSVLRNRRYQVPTAILVLLFNLVYAFCFSILSFLSVTIMLAFMTVPFVIIFRRAKDFYFAKDVMRLLFIIFFFSTAIWKIRAGGIFNFDQMAGVLVTQHNYLLLDNNSGFFRNLITYLIEYPRLSFSLYLAAFIAEFSFIAGLFTKKYDRYLLFIFLAFALFNYLTMRINYFSWFPFLACLHLSKQRK